MWYLPTLTININQKMQVFVYTTCIFKPTGSNPPQFFVKLSSNILIQNSSPVSVLWQKLGVVFHWAYEWGAQQSQASFLKVNPVNTSWVGAFFLAVGSPTWKMAMVFVLGWMAPKLIKEARVQNQRYDMFICIVSLYYPKNYHPCTTYICLHGWSILIVVQSISKYPLGN